ncbi:hypothetical protein [Segeticoccus rhizosphaerae]|jgi:hypothetical protein|uniref:hypothetical protein n=1 Tax=Segeticoccus rhizosphaerae TaxID=1104777 RepID=UPI0010BF778E|nr:MULTISPECIES: hypothetical protein [Intrasporangiaceae]
MDPIAVRLLRARGIEVPVGDHQEVEDHWQSLLAGRQGVDEAMLGDFDIPLVFPAQGHDRDA